MKLAPSIIPNDGLRIHEEFHLWRHVELGSWHLGVFPNPAEVTGLAMISNEDTSLGRRDVVGDVGTKLVPYEIKWVCRTNLWRVGMEFVGGLTCCLIPNSSLWGLYVLVECFLYSDKVLASNIGDVGPEELCRDLNYSTVLSPMFQVKGAINDLVCLDVVMGKGFSTGGRDSSTVAVRTTFG